MRSNIVTLAIIMAAVAAATTALFSAATSAFAAQIEGCRGNPHDDDGSGNPHDDDGSGNPHNGGFHHQCPGSH
jgi:hypothetical protein